MTRRFTLAGALEMDEELPNGDADGDLNGDKLLMVKRVAAARLNGAIRMNDEIERIISRHNLER